jgi:RNA polymerase sigma-70 factor (ECF subfamily)
VRSWLVDDGVSDPLARDLVARLRVGEAAALTLAYERHAEAILRFLVRLCGRRDLAEDLFQETWIRLARHARRLEEGTNLRAWLYAVARNLFRDHARRAGLDAASLGTLGGWWYLDVPVGPGAPDETAIAADAARRLERAFARLPANAREILLLVAAEGFAVDEAARILEIAPEAARQRLHRARADLARALTRHARRDSA